MKDKDCNRVSNGAKIRNRYNQEALYYVRSNMVNNIQLLTNEALDMM